MAVTMVTATTDEVELASFHSELVTGGAVLKAASITILRRMSTASVAAPLALELPS
jgi:hypothetical protein